MQHNIRSGLSCLHEQDISYIVLYGGYAAPNRLEETVRWHGSECRRAHQPNRLEETVRWHGSEHSGVVHFEQARRDCEVAWLCVYIMKRG
jgi:hypothetical protein